MNYLLLLQFNTTKIKVILWLVQKLTVVGPRSGPRRQIIVFNGSYYAFIYIISPSNDNHLIMTKASG